MKSVLSRLTVRPGLLVLAVCLIALYGTNLSTSALSQTECSSGKLAATLTGWSIDGKTPKGRAEFSGGRLNVTVNSVNMDDGTKLFVFVNDDRIGEMSALKDGAAEVSVNMPKAEEGAYIMIKSAEDRPIVSAGLACSKAK